MGVMALAGKLAGQAMADETDYDLLAFLGRDWVVLNQPAFLQKYDEIAQRRYEERVVYMDLIGATVESIWKKDEYTIILKTDRGYAACTAEGDCCSISYYEDFTNTDALIGSPIEEIVNHSYEDRDEDTDYDLIQHYALEFRTAKGYTRFAYRNESNGYYGGYTSIYLAQVPDLIELTPVVDN